MSRSMFSHYGAGKKGGGAEIVLWTAAGAVAVALVAYLVYEWVRASKTRSGSKTSPNPQPSPPPAQPLPQPAPLPPAPEQPPQQVPLAPLTGEQPNNVMGFYPYSSQVTNAYDYKFPESEQPQSLTKTAHLPSAIAQAAAGATGSPYDMGYQLNASKLMPASWRGPQDCAAADLEEDTTNWAKFAPTKQAFDQYITAAGSARLAQNTRNSNAKVLGVPNLLRAGPPAPLTAIAHRTLDSSFRQDLIANTTGIHANWASGVC